MARSILGSEKLTAFVATRKPDVAKKFYRDTLGLRLLSEDEFALVFDANGTMLRVTLVADVVVAPYTVLGWQVADVVAVAKSLMKARVTFERYPGMPQDDMGIWTSPGGARVAWFKDPEGHTLSISQH